MAKAGRPAGDSLDFDAWETEGDPFPPGYSPDKFYTGARDNKGHANAVKVWVPTHVWAELNEVVHRRDVPAYRSMQDAFRDAVCHRFVYLRSEGFQIDSLLEAIKIDMNNAEIAWIVDRKGSLDESVNTHEMSLRAAHESGNQQLLMLAVGSTQEHAESMPSPWSERMLELAKQYRGYIK